MSEHKSHDAAEVKEILEVVADKVPHLLTQLRNTLFSADAGRELGQAVGAFYKELIENGIPADEALKMAKDYISTLQGVLSHAKLGGKGHAHGGD